MNISNKNCEQFEAIGTIFAFQERRFYPDSEMYRLSLPEIYDLLEQAELDLSGVGSINFSSSQVSDLSDQALYDFCFNLLGDKKYIPNFYPGMLDDYSQEVLEDRLDTFSSYMVPQVSPSTRHNGPSYFGGFQDKEGNTIKLIKVPAGVWKLEIYNEPRITWNTYYQNKYRIIDSDLIQVINETGRINRNGEQIIDLLYKPCLKIYFGPMYDTRIEDQSYSSAIKNEIYSNRYYAVSVGVEEDRALEEAYNSYTNVMSELDYMASYKGEIMSDKILYLSYSSSGKINEVKFIETSFNHHKNPGRNQNKLSMRMDDYLAHDFCPIKDYGNIAVDKSSGLLLGTRDGDVTIDGEKKSGFKFFEKLKEDSSPSLRTTKTRKITIDGKELVNGNREKLPQNPITSPDWILNRNLDSGYKKCKLSIEKGGSVVRKVRGIEEPIEGSKFFKEGSSLAFKPIESTGYKFSGVSPEADTIEGEYYIYSTIPDLITFSFRHEIYTFRIHLTCEKDFYRSGGSKIEFDTNSYYSEFINERNIKLYVKDSVGNFIEYDPDKRGIINVDETSEISFKLDYGDYYLPVSFEPDHIFTVNLEDLKIFDNYADYDIEIAVIKPKVYLFGNVNFGRTRHFNVDYNGSLTVEFYSEDPLWDNPWTAVDHIFISRGDRESINPTVESQVYNPGKGDGFRYLTVSGIIDKVVEINIWTEE